MPTPVLTQFDDVLPPDVSGQVALPKVKLGAADVDLNNFLSRPVKIYSAVTTAADFSIDPWNLFLTNPAVARRVTNYRYIRATICIRYSESAMPFIYGCRQICTIPFNSNQETRYVNSTDYSHLNCSYTNPSVQSAYEMKLPYHGPHRYYVIKDLQTTSVSGNLWRVAVNNIVPYRRCDSPTTPNTTCSIHAWLEDVELAVPIATDSALAVTYQSEYSGVISHPASVVSNAASILSKVPVLAPYTDPISRASGMLAKMAHTFGFSRPVQLEAPAPVYNNVDNNMCVSTYMDTAQKLTLDPKQGVTVGTADYDTSKGDNLAFANFTKKETLLTTVFWTQAQSIGTNLKIIPVNPCTLGNDSTAFPRASLTGVGVAAMPFRFWHGTIKFRIKMVASAYHRGRIRIYWSPTLLNGNTESIFNQLESHVVDVTSSDTVITVGYAAREYYRSVIYHDSTGTGNDIANNGYLYVRVSQELNAPVRRLANY